MERMVRVFKVWVVLWLVLGVVRGLAFEGGGARNGAFQVYLLEFPELASTALGRINEFRGKAEEHLAREDLPGAVREALSVLALQPPLRPDERLSAAAAAHARDMLERAYFSHVSPDGLSPLDRTLAAGYPAVFVGEALAALVFERPVSPERALEVLLKELTGDALSMGSAEGAPLVFPFYRHAGAALAAGTLSFEGREYYAYVLVIVLGLPEGLVPADETRGFLLGRLPVEGGEPVVLRSVSSERGIPLTTLADGSFFASGLPPDLYVLNTGEASRLVYVSPGELIVVE